MSGSNSAGSKSFEAKVVILGATMVGKTSIIARAVNGAFDQNIASTIGACYQSKMIELPGSTVNLQIWDTAGQERFRTLAPMYYRGSVVALLVFSLTQNETLSEVVNWAKELNEQTDEKPALIIVGNKNDLVNDRTVSPTQAEEVAKQLNALYFEVSAKTNAGIDDLFNRIAEEAVKKLGGNVRPVASAPVPISETAPKNSCC